MAFCTAVVCNSFSLHLYSLLCNVYVSICSQLDNFRPHCIHRFTDASECVGLLHDVAIWMFLFATSEHVLCRDHLIGLVSLALYLILFVGNLHLP